MADHSALTYPLLKVAHQKFSLHPSELSAEQRAHALQIAARQQQIEQAVLESPEAANIVISADQVNAALARISASLGGHDGLENVLKETGLDLPALITSVQRELRVDAVLDTVCATLRAVTDTDARLYYYMNPERFVRPETRVARHILITINPDFPENVRERALHRTREISQRLQRKPERFGEQALKHSECPSALQGGLMGNVIPGKLFPTLETALFDLKAGQVSEVVESPLGFHVLKCDSIVPAGPLALDDILPRLREMLEQQQRERLQRRWISERLRLTASQPEGRLANG